MGHSGTTLVVREKRPLSRQQLVVVLFGARRGGGVTAQVHIDDAQLCSAGSETLAFVTYICIDRSRPNRSVLLRGQKERDRIDCLIDGCDRILEPEMTVHVTSFASGL